MNKEIMLDYIKDTPNAIQQLVNSFKENYSKVKLPKVKNVILVGSGSSYNTANQVRLFYENYLGLNTRVYHPDSFQNLKKINTSSNYTICIFISETGTSTGTNNALQKAKNWNLKTITLTQKENTPLAQNGDYYFNFCCGPEECNAKTKGYTNNLILLYLLGTKLSNADFDVDDLISQIKIAKQNISSLIDSFPDWLENYKDLVKLNQILVVGADAYRGTTEEAALKLSETLLIPSAFTSAEEFPHGYHRTISEDSNIIFINSKQYPLDKTCQYFSRICNKVLLINTVDNMDGDINITPLKYHLESLVISVVFQLMAYYLPTFIGLDPNRDAHDDYCELINNRLN